MKAAPTTAMGTKARREQAGVLVSATLLAALLAVKVRPELAVTAHEFEAATLACAALALAAHLAGGLSRGGAFAAFVVAFTLWIGAGAMFLLPLLMTFMLTWLSTTIGRNRKLRLEAEERHGRDALQVLANSGAAALGAIFLRGVWAQFAIVAILAEAAADTVASEIGKAFGGAPRMITSRRKAEPGANGAVTWVGSVAGIAAALLVAACVTRTWPELWPFAPLAALAGVAGMLFDSLLGATLEPPLNNDAVNFLGTCFAAGLNCALLWKLH
ncbi:MAG: DUF92 domain-containing protein [Acidobacteria bacterium]|nr:DUF92 domain-containing protein [Acidobacteriota bacterium]